VLSFKITNKRMRTKQKIGHYIYASDQHSFFLDCVSEQVPFLTRHIVLTLQIILKHKLTNYETYDLVLAFSLGLAAFHNSILRDCLPKILSNRSSLSGKTLPYQQLGKLRVLKPMNISLQD